MSLYGIPLMIMIFCYSRIICLLNAHVYKNKTDIPMSVFDDKTQTLIQKNRNNSLNKMRHKTLRMSALFGKIRSYFNTLNRNFNL